MSTKTPMAWHPRKNYVPTKYRAPWLIKAGDEICLYTTPGSPAPSVYTVTSTSRHIGIFTGATVFRLHYECPFKKITGVVDAYGRQNNLPAEKVLITA